MHARLPWVLLAVSVAANVFLVGGAAYTLIGRDGPTAERTAPIDAAGERLGLTPAERDGLLALREKVRGRREAMRATHDRRRGAFLGELGKPAFDRARVTALMDERWMTRRDHFADLAQGLHAYLATLTPEQRAEFLVMARERGFLRGLFGRKRPPKAD